MTTQRPRLLSACQLCLPLALASTLGCASIDKGLQDLLEPLEETPAVAVQPTIPPDVPTFTVELRSAKRPVASIPVALDRVLHVQDALEKSGASANFRRMNVELYRPLPGGFHRLEVRYNRNTHSVDPRFDYEILPNDRLVITEDTSNTIDDMLEQLSGPLGALGG